MSTKAYTRHSNILVPDIRGAKGGKGGGGRGRGRGKSRSRWGGKYEVYLPDFTPGGRDNGRKSKGQRRIMGIRKVMNGRRGRGAV